MNTDAILKKYINKTIEIYAKLGQNSVRSKGILLGYSSGYILNTDQGIQVLNNIDGVTFGSLPDGFFTMPTLNWKVFSKKATKTNC